MLSQNQLIYVKMETVQGTDSTPGATDFLAVHALSVKPNVEYMTPEARDHSLSKRPGVLGKKFMDVTFTHEIQVNNSAPTVPPVDAILQSCGWDDMEGAAATDGLYYPASIQCLGATKVPFDAGSGTVAIGDIVTGTNSGANGLCVGIQVASGAWASDAAGYLYLKEIQRGIGAANQTTGSGADDMSSSGTYTGTANATFVVTIDAEGTPDTFTWTKDGAGGAAGVAITGAAQTLSDGVSITFVGTDNHDNGDAWTVYVTDTYINDELLTVSGTECTVNGSQIAPSCTVWCFYENVAYKVTGCVGNIEFKLSAGKISAMDITLTGQYIKGADVTFPTSVTDDGGAPLVAMGQAFSWGSEYPCVESLTFSLGNQISVPVCLSKTHASADARIVNRDPSVSWNPEARTAANEDIFTPHAAVTQSAITYKLSNGTVDVDISLPKVEISDIKDGDRDGIKIWDITGVPVRTFGDDEISIAFSAT